MYKKVYVGVIVEFLKDGGLRPRKILWEDGAIYIIDRVKFIDTAPAKSGGFLTTRFTCLFGEKERYLYYEKERDRWFVEVCVLNE